eukprot:GFUD01030414.1.p1 GENE.GFUD01030414.1~~GFUD01030414.1.p1  ORF type:complete len:398 (-),score=116.94 GFUD01030414.1:163-1314(-)
MDRKPKLRALKDLPIYIEEDHHEVLPHIFKNIGAKHLPIEKNTLVHFDSHPDMLIPKDLVPEEAFDKFKLFQKLSIENWILPGAFVGVFSTIVWVCPPWSDQIAAGEYSFQIGRNKLTNQLAVTCLESYYISEGLFTIRSNLDNVKEIKLIVIKLEESPENLTEFKDQMMRVQEQIDEVDHYILDIDLDFFSTLNPFVTLYSEAGLYEKLKKIYTFNPVPQNMEYSAKIELALKFGDERREMLDKLESIFTYLTMEENLAMYEGPGEELLGPISQLVDSVRKHYPRQEIDWKLVHDAGCTFDDSELPHHISSKAEIQTMLRLTEQFLDRLDKSPTIVTISRSSCDDYCPQDQVEDIQMGVLTLLKMKFGRVTEHHCYQEEGGN